MAWQLYNILYYIIYNIIIDTLRLSSLNNHHRQSIVKRDYEKRIYNAVIIILSARQPF